MTTAAPAKAERTKTTYVVLSVHPDGEGRYDHIGPGKIEAASSDEAIRVVAADRGAGTYIAVPLRSFQPRSVKLEQTTVVKVG